MSQKFTYVNADGFTEESAGAFETADHTSTSAGVGNAGDPIILDAAGKLDSSLFDISAIDHGGLGGLGDDDHTIYTLAAGTRAFTGDQSMGTNQLTNVGDPTTLTIDSASDDAIPMSLLASTSTGEGASIIGIFDTAGYFTSTSVEGALAELFESAGNAPYTTDGVGVTKGDLVHISANDVITLTALSTNAWSIGLALTTAGAAASVSVTSNDQILAGVLTAATAGDTYYWSGTAHTATIPAGGGNYVWKTGVAKNATDLHVEVEFIRKTATP
jgi:hypothetical protein